MKATREMDDFLARPPRGWWSRGGKWAAVVTAVVMLALLGSRCAGGGQRLEYVTGLVTRGDLSVSVSATGTLRPTNQIDVGSEISGIVERVMVDVNDRVTRGQVLAIIDTARLHDQVTQSTALLAANQSAVRQARATLKEATLQLARLREVRRLSGGQTPAETELATQEAAVERAAGALQSAEANVTSARAQLSSNQTQVARAVIRAPVTGVVLKRTVDPGQTVQAAFNTPELFVIAEDLSVMKLEVSIDEADIGQVHEGQPASFTVDAFPGRTFPAAITRVDLGSRNLTTGGGATGSASEVVSYTANLAVRNPDGSLRPGMTATATVRTAEIRHALLVPNAALRFVPPPAAVGGGGFAIRPPDARPTRTAQQREVGPGSQLVVYVLQPDNSLRAVSVTTGRSDGRLTTVTGAGLTSGMKVVTGVRSQEATDG